MTELTSENIAEVTAKQDELIRKITQPTSAEIQTVMTVGKDDYAISMANREQWLKEIEHCTDFSPIVPQSQVEKVFAYKDKKSERAVGVGVSSGIVTLLGGWAASLYLMPDSYVVLMGLSVFFGTPWVAVCFAGGLASFLKRGLKHSDWALNKVAEFTAQGFKKWLLRQHNIEISLEASTRLIKEMLFSGSENKTGCNITRNNIEYHFKYDRASETIQFVDKKATPVIVQNGSVTSLVRPKATQSKIEEIILPEKIQTLYSDVLAEASLLFATDYADEAARIQNQLEKMVNDYRKVVHLDEEGLAADKLTAVVFLLQDEIRAVKRKALEAGLADLDIHREYLISRQKHQGTAHPIHIENKPAV